METHLWVGSLRGSESERFLVLARDRLDAERYVTATLGEVEPASLALVEDTEGVVVGFDDLDSGPLATRLVANHAIETAIAMRPEALAIR